MNAERHASPSIEAMKLVIIVAPFELRDTLARDLERHEARGYTIAVVDGHGMHGPRRYGILDGANVRFETLVEPDVARRLLAHVAERYSGRELVAYAIDAERCVSGVLPVVAKAV